ncbi:hypothetical protein AGMMS50218_01660 [Actinomycetota bacterium]|nr:hypothetical protein AGMMS50218_01660 [Actinomycetota bacterium]
MRVRAVPAVPAVPARLTLRARAVRRRRRVGVAHLDILAHLDPPRPTAATGGPSRDADDPHPTTTRRGVAVRVGA